MFTPPLLFHFRRQHAACRDAIAADYFITPPLMPAT